jgi:hypothetical protein
VAAALAARSRGARAGGGLEHRVLVKRGG